MPCKTNTKEFGIVSFSGTRMTEIGVALFMSKYTNTISHVTSIYLNKSHLRELPFIRYASLNNYGDNVSDFSDNFLKEFNGLESITDANRFTLNLENNLITKFQKVTLKTYVVGFVDEINLKYMNNSVVKVKDSLTLIELVGRFRLTYI